MLPRRIPKYVAYHEAGHAVACIRFRRRFDRVEAWHNVDGIGGYLKHGPRTLGRVRDRHDALISLAGPVAECRCRRRPIFDLMDWQFRFEHTSDFRKALESAGDDLIGRWAWDIHRLIRRWWPMVTAVAEALLAQQEDGHALLYYSEVRGILEGMTAN